MHKHPANIARHDKRTRGQVAADRVAAALGSWRFIGIQSALIVAWTVVNAITGWWDPYPFIALNLCLSLQAAYAAPILQLSGNRQAQHDRDRAEVDFETNQKALRMVQRITAHLGLDE